MQQSRCRTNIPKVNVKLTEGLQELMGDISREVLRSQPDCSGMHKFIADYLEGLLSTRERTIEILETNQMITAQLLKRGLNENKAEIAANIILHAFNDYVEFIHDPCKTEDEYVFKEVDILKTITDEGNFTKEELCIIRKIIGSTFDTFLKKYTKSFMMTETCYRRNYPSVVNTFGAITKIFPTEDEMELAARTIQAYYRGYLARKKFAQLKQVQEKKIMDPKTAVRIIENIFLQYKQRKQFARYREAALTIQAAFRGYLERIKCSGERIANIDIKVDVEGISPRSVIDFVNPSGIKEIHRKIQEYFEESTYGRELQRRYEAALKIQSTYRGFVARKGFIKIREGLRLQQTVIRIDNKDKKKFMQQFFPEEEIIEEGDLSNLQQKMTKDDENVTKEVASEVLCDLITGVCAEKHPALKLAPQVVSEVITDVVAEKNPELKLEHEVISKVIADVVVQKDNLATTEKVTNTKVNAVHEKHEHVAAEYKGDNEQLFQNTNSQIIQLEKDGKKTTHKEVKKLEQKESKMSKHSVRQKHPKVPSIETVNVEEPLKTEEAIKEKAKEDRLKDILLPTYHAVKTGRGKTEVVESLESLEKTLTALDKDIFRKTREEEHRKMRLFFEENLADLIINK